MYTLHLSPIELYIMQNSQTITLITQPVAMETPAHACSVYRALSPPPHEGSGNKARFNCEGLNCDFCCSIKFIQFGLDLKVTLIPNYCNTETLTIVGLAVL